MTSKQGLRIGIVNPTSLVGKEIKSILHDRGVPYARIELIDTAGQAAGTLTEVGDEAAVVTAASDDAFEELDVVFFCGSASANAPWIAKHGQRGFVAVDLSQPSSIAAEGVPVVAGVNLQDLKDDTRLIISPHPTAIPITLVLHQMASRVPVKLAAVSVIQPVSEFDQQGIDELLGQVIKVLNVKGFPKEVFDRQTAFNLYPAAGAADTERYAAAQVRRVLHTDLTLTMTITQGGLFHSHSFSMFVQTDQDLSEAELLAALRESDAILVSDSDETFGTIDAGGSDQVMVGRAMKDPAIPNCFWLWIVADNLRRSSALNGVLAAEALMAKLLADA